MAYLAEVCEIASNTLSIEHTSRNWLPGSHLLAVWMQVISTINLFLTQMDELAKSDCFKTNGISIHIDKHTPF